MNKPKIIEKTSHSKIIQIAFGIFADFLALAILLCFDVSFLLALFAFFFVSEKLRKISLEVFEEADVTMSWSKDIYG